MEIIFIGLTVLGCVFDAQCQSYRQRAEVVNPDYIYYNRDDFGKRVDSSIKVPSPGLQPPIHWPEVSPLSRTGNGGLVNNVIVSNVDRGRNEYNVVSTKNKEPFDQTAAALTNFSLSLMKNVLEQKSGNAVVSPYSISALLSLLQQGTTDQALQQISLALQMAPQASAAAYKAQNKDFQSRNSRNILRTANNIFVSYAFSVNPQFSAIAQTDFGSDVTHTAFADTGKAANQINGWVAQKTNNKIDKLISPDAISANTQMVLVNAIYFKGLWEIPFRPQSTKSGVFHVSGGGSKTVPFMTTTRTFRAGIDRQIGSKVIVLPFEGQEYSLMIILPSMLIGAHDTFQTLSTAKLETYLNMGPLEVSLTLPRFSIRADTDLTPILRKMGITKIFEQQSDLSGIGNYGNQTPQVSSAVHSAVLSIDEQGGSAAAATAFNVVALSNDDPSLVINVNMPFIAVLWDGKSKVPLFMATIEDPSV